MSQKQTFQSGPFQIEVYYNEDGPCGVAVYNGDRITAEFYRDDEQT